MTAPDPRPPGSRWTPRRAALAWGVAAALATAALSGGPGISRQEAAVLSDAGAASGAAFVPARPPLAATLSRATHALALRAHLPHLTGYRLAPALFAGLLAALVAALAAALGGPAAAALAPALILFAPRLLLALVQAGGATPAAAFAVATVLAYRGAVGARSRAARLGAAAAAGALLGLAIAAQLEAAVLLAALALHAAFLAVPRRRAALEPDADPDDGAPHPRSALAAVGAMAVLAPALAFALWPALWGDPVRRLAGALQALSADPQGLGAALARVRPPWGWPAVTTALALPASLVVAFAGGIVHAAARAATPGVSRAEWSDDLLLLLAAAAPLAAAHALRVRAPGLGAWLAAFPFLAALAARAVVAAARGLWPSRVRPIGAALAAAALLPGLAATIHAWPDLGASWGELAGGAPGAASRGLPRHDGALSPAVLDAVAARARPGARVRWAATAPAALAVYAADGRIRPDLAIADSLDDADLAVVPASAGARQEEFQIWAALRTRSPVAGVFLDEVPLAWIYARPGAWR